MGRLSCPADEARLNLHTCDAIYLVIIFLRQVCVRCYLFVGLIEIVGYL